MKGGSDDGDDDGAHGGDGARVSGLGGSPLVSPCLPLAGPASQDV